MQVGIFKQKEKKKEKKRGEECLEEKIEIKQRQGRKRIYVLL